MGVKEQTTRLDEKPVFRSQTRLCNANTGKYANTQPLAKTGNMVTIYGLLLALGPNLVKSRQPYVGEWRSQDLGALKCWLEVADVQDVEDSESVWDGSNLFVSLCHLLYDGGDPAVVID